MHVYIKFHVNPKRNGDLLGTLAELSVMQGYYSKFSILVNENEHKLIGLKLRDYHMLVQQFLPIALRLIMQKSTRDGIVIFCFFNYISCK